jgi:hypothetical protein
LVRPCFPGAVYTNNRSTLNDDTGRRLENLFWRIWSSERISSVIRGSTIARLLLEISDGPSTRPEIEHIWRQKKRKKQKKKARINVRIRGLSDFYSFLVPLFL